jgi:hypothetical protein
MTTPPPHTTAFPGPPARPDVPGFTVRTLLGFGSHGEVWLGEDVVSGEAFALKIGRPPGSGPPGTRDGGASGGRGDPCDPGGDPGEPDAAEALAREVALLARIDDPHVVRLHRVVRLHAGGHALVLEHAGGGNLGALVAARGALDPAEVTTLVVPLAQALERLHARGLAHGDLSPGNVLFAADGRPMLSDLGVSRLLGITGPGPHGTPGFVDPALGRGVDPRAGDVWSLAALGWFALTGRPPGPGVRPPVALEAPALTRLLSEVLGADPAERPAAGELANRAWDAVRPAPIRLLPGTGPAADADAFASRTTRRVPPPGDLPRATPVPPSTSGRRAVRRRDVDRGASPRTAARPVRASRARAPAARSARAPRLTGAAVAAAVLLAGGGAAAWAVDRASQGAEAASERVRTAAGPGHAARELAAVLHTIGRARAAAFATASTAPLAGADERGSPAMAADERLVRDLAARRWRLTGVRYAVTDLRVVHRDARAATVTAWVTTSEHRRTTSDGHLVGHVAAEGPRRVTLTLVAVPGTGWRVRSVS